MDPLLRLALLGAQVEELFAGRNTDVTQPLPPARQLPHKGYTRAQGEAEDRARAARKRAAQR